MTFSSNLTGHIIAASRFTSPLIVLWLTAHPSVAATRTAASAQYSDVAAAVSQAQTGDTVTVPAGSATWSSTLNVGSKAISIIGAGSGSTIINNSAGCLFRWSNTGANPLRLSGFRFNNSDNQSPIVGIAGPATKIRVDHCIFNKGDCAVGANFASGSSGTGPTYGVVDHCTFINMKRPDFAMDSRNNDGGEAAWAENIIQPGTDKMMYWEDNQFTWDSNLTDVNAQGALYGQYGGKACHRYNTYTGMDGCIDAHGDNPSQSTMFYEIYNNTFNHGAYLGQGEAAWQRGGKWIVHDNTFNYPYTSVIHLSVYWVADAAAHRVKNSYFWGNTANGNTNQSSIVGIKDSGQTPAGYSAANLLVNRDYFLHAPQSGETFYPYTPLVHPHPLVGGAVGGTPTPTPAPTPPPTPTPTPLGTSFNSTQGEISSPFTTNSDSTISQSVETDDPVDGGQATYTFSVPNSGDYTIFCIVNCPDESSNSVFVDIDSDPSSSMAWQIPVTSGFESRTVTWSGITSPRFWTLGVGTHQLVIRGREAGTKIKSITLVARPAPPGSLELVPGTGN